MGTMIFEIAKTYQVAKTYQIDSVAPAIAQPIQFAQSSLKREILAPH